MHQPVIGASMVSMKRRLAFIYKGKIRQYKCREWPHKVCQWKESPVINTMERAFSVAIAVPEKMCEMYEIEDFKHTKVGKMPTF